jgi:hypothetical protein
MAYTTIDDPTIYFNTVLYTGNGTSQSITGVGFQPDWIWLKSRTTAEYHTLYDSVRGSASNYKQIYSNATNAEVTPGTAGLTAIGTDGFTLGANDNSNASSQNFTSWNWLASNTTASNTDGSITSTVSANTTAGFSIVSYTGAGGSSNVGHGLGVAPNFIIAKNRDSGSLSWFVSNDAIGWTKRLKLDGTNTAATNVAFGDTDPDSTKFYLQDNNLNTSGQDHIAYCFAEKKGYSKFGSYTGNGNADGTFVYTGFSPAWVMIKNTEGTDNWNIYDNKRLGYNTNYSFLIANESNAENTTTSTANLDILSNGFKVRASTGHLNTSGDKYIYMAFAESPFVNSNGIPNNAR